MSKLQQVQFFGNINEFCMVFNFRLEIFEDFSDRYLSLFLFPHNSKKSKVLLPCGANKVVSYNVSSLTTLECRIRSIPLVRDVFIWFLESAVQLTNLQFIVQRKNSQFNPSALSWCRIICSFLIYCTSRCDQCMQRNVHV